MVVKNLTKLKRQLYVLSTAVPERLVNDVLSFFTQVPMGVINVGVFTSFHGKAES